MAINIGVFHNGGLDLAPKMTRSGVSVAGGGLDDSHRSAQRIIEAQVRQGILADRLGFDFWFQTEHHFQPEGAELNPSPVLTQMAIASATRQIRLGQMANIATWWHPVRLAEQAAMLDVVSGGRLEFGIGRGYQPRETEVFGQAYGSTIQDQERNRAYFYEAYEVIKKCWTEGSFSHHGQFYTVPPTYTKWNHKQTIAYFDEPGAGRSVADVLKLGEPDALPNLPVMATSTTLRELSVLPQPLQQPHPQFWEPIYSTRSTRWAAQNGFNGFFIVEPAGRLKKAIDMYYAAAEEAGWPDRLGRGRFKRGWDAEKRRGVGTARYIHVVDKGIGNLDKATAALEHQWDFLTSFGFGVVLAEEGDDFDMNMRVTADLLRQKKVALHGSKQYIIDSIMELYEICGYEDFLLSGWFEGSGFESEEVEDQMQYFAEEIMPVLHREYGHTPNPGSTVNLDARPRSRQPMAVAGD